ncbi:MAG: cyclic nucleotide-binding domain-containing protein [Deltaproteobacteria bacterium]|nr:cyclic nucleotide-binding domain-containing protein [Deltaproteobacteria bacterium]
MVTRKLLTQDANQRLRTGDLDGALRGLIALVRSAPHDLDARQRMGDALLAANAIPQSVQCYAFVAREGTLSGHPLEAIVALKVLTRIDPTVQGLLTPLAQRYAAGSPSLGKSVRLAPADPESEVPSAAFVPNELSAEQIIALAGQVGASREGLPGYPALVAPIPLLSELPADAFERMLATVELRRLAPGQAILKEGDAGDAFFMLVRGTASVSRRNLSTTEDLSSASEVVLATLSKGAIIGEMALVSGAPRTATVAMVDDGDVLVFGRDAITAVAREIDAVAQALGRFTRDRLLQNLLATHPIFRPFDRTQRAQLAARFSAHDAPAESVIIREDSQGRGLFLLLTGQVDITRRGASGPVVLATLGPGEVFGEISLLDQTPTTATVTTSRNSTVLFLARELFERLIAGVPELRAYFEELAQERVMDTNLTMSAEPDPNETSTFLV